MAGVRGASVPAGHYISSSRRVPRLGVFLLALSALFFGVNFTQEWLNSRHVEERAAYLRQQIAASNRLNARLQQQIVFDSSKEYIIPAARALGMVRPNDTLIAIKQLPPRVKTVVVRVPAPQPPANLLTRLLHSVFR